MVLSTPEVRVGQVNDAPVNAIVWTLVGVAVALAGLNQYLLFSLPRTGKSAEKSVAAPVAAASAIGTPDNATVGLTIASGAPDIYGSELRVSYDDVQASMNIMGQYDPDYGTTKLTLTPELQQRYIAIGTRISCEYCCGAKSIVFPNGKAACGCAHSQAMRGLIAYLLNKHATEFSDDRILQELARWKARFFPKQMIAKVANQRASGQYTPDVAALLLNQPAGSSKSVTAPLPSSLQNLPNMVGGC